MKSCRKVLLLFKNILFHNCILLILFIGLHVQVFSQSIRELSTKDGLPQSFVSGLVQDDSSFIWIGTRNGIARYDGIQFKIFQHDPFDTSTIASNLIIWIKKDNQNHLWIEHESGEIDEINPATEKIIHLLKGNTPDSNGLQFNRRGWMVDKDGIFWGIKKGNGLNSYDPVQKKLDVFTSHNCGLPSDTILGIVEMKNHAIWVLSDRSISLFDKHAKKYTHWLNPLTSDYNIFPEMPAITIDLHERRNGELMWGDCKQLFFFNPQTHLFRTVLLPDRSYLGVRWIRTDAEGVDYLESFGRVYRYSDSSGLIRIGSSIAESFGDLKSFMVDLSGILWMGTNANGIHQIDLHTPFFQSYVYKKEFSSDILQMEFGVNMQQLFNWTAKQNSFSQPSYHLRSVFDKHRRLYLALHETVCYYDSLEKKLISLPRAPVVLNKDEAGIGIKGITIAPDGSPVIIGYSGNILIYQFASASWKPLMEPMLIRNKYGNHLLPQDMISDGENIWITTSDDGLLKLDIKTSAIEQLKQKSERGSLPTNQLLGIRQDPANTDLLWIGSYQGLICLHKKTLLFDVYSSKEGLPDNTVYSILSDRRGDLWLSTNKGLCRFNSVTHQTRVFRTNHGLPGDEFNRFHHLEMPDGRLIFGGTSGWTIFDPLLIRDDSFEPVVALTDFKINNKDALQIKGSKIPMLPVNAMEQLQLTYDQNTLSFSFAGLEFNQPQDLQYRYRLIGYDNDWVIAGNAHQAIYTKIPPGKYTLLVNASNSTGIWSSKNKMLSLVIAPPWWATSMAYLCYSIILAGLIWTYIRFRISSMVMRNEMVLKEKESMQLKELDDMKSRFFSNITHEFRTPLTLIMGPAEQIKSDQYADPKQSRLADTIVKNAKQLLILINRLMDLSKLEARALKLLEQRGNPAHGVGSIVLSFETDAAVKEIQLLFENQCGHLECWFYADALERIVYNLVSNALKFTPAGGKVEIILSANDEFLQLTVKDNGMGIQENKLPYIFDRFYQADDQAGLATEQWDSGTGIGLSLVKELVIQMKGEIDVESRNIETHPENPGTRFILTIPYRADEIAPELSIESLTDFKEGEDREDVTDKLPLILIVEDSQELAGFIMGILSDKYEVHHELNGASGLDYTMNHMPDLIISDVMMPVMDGYELCKRLKVDIRSSHIPVVLLTAKVTKENLIEGLSKGADDYLTKPFHPTELILRVRNLLERQRKLRDLIRQELSMPGVIIENAEPAVQDIFLTRLYELLDEHLDDSLFGVDQLVGLINMSRSSLHRKLKSITGMSTTEVVRNYRLRKATGFLKEGFSSSDTAYKSGFGSPAYFTKSFREVYGMTPGDYIKSFNKIKD